MISRPNWIPFCNGTFLHKRRIIKEPQYNILVNVIAPFPRWVISILTCSIVINSEVEYALSISIKRIQIVISKWWKDLRYDACIGFNCAPRLRIAIKITSTNEAFVTIWYLGWWMTSSAFITVFSEDFEKLSEEKFVSCHLHHFLLKNYGRWLAIYILKTKYHFGERELNTVICGKRMGNGNKTNLSNV